MSGSNDYKQYVPRKWVSVDFGTPSKAVTKVLVRTTEGFVEECSYNRHTKVWTSTEDGSTIDNVKEWSLLADSVPARRPT